MTHFATLVSKILVCPFTSGNFLSSMQVLKFKSTSSFCLVGERIQPEDRFYECSEKNYHTFADQEKTLTRKVEKSLNENLPLATFFSRKQPCFCASPHQSRSPSCWPAPSGFPFSWIVDEGQGCHSVAFRPRLKRH